MWMAASTPVAGNANPRSDPMLRPRLVNDFRAGFAAFLEMGIRSSGTANWSNNHACSIERQRIIEAHSLNAVIEDFCRTSKGCCGLRFVLEIWTLFSEAIHTKVGTIPTSNCSAREIPS